MSPSMSRIAVDYDPDYKPSLSDTSFLDNRFAIEHAVRTQRMKVCWSTTSTKDHNVVIRPLQKKKLGYTPPKKKLGYIYSMWKPVLVY